VTSARAGGAAATWVPFVAPAWDLGRVRLQPAGRPLVMGIVNLTPDSFWAGSRAAGADAAVAQALRLLDEGADLLDLGAASSRPGAPAVGAAEEQDRLLPALARLRLETDAPLTVDTTRAETAALALDAGADAVNDITGAGDPGMLPLVAARGCGLVLMHMQGTPGTMQRAPRYADVVADVAAWLADRGRQAEAAGVPAARLAVDPGIGFGKTTGHNLDLLAGLDRVAGGRTLLLGTSRKSFLGAVTGAPVEARLPGSLATLAIAWRAGATVVRVHDVGPTVQYLDTLRAVAAARP
jgi:dihydropteroate synthase